MPALLASAAASTPSQSNGGNQKVIKDPAEYHAYIAARNLPDPVQKAAALEAFVQSYPDSVVKIDALEHAMSAYQQSGNLAKLADTARRILAMQPNNLRALAILTYLGGEDRDGKDEFCSNAQKGLQEMFRWQNPEGTPEAESHKMRAQMLAIFNGAAGFCALQAKDYAAARDYYLKALQINPNNMQNVYQLGIADLEMKPIDVTGFWYIAKAVNLAQTQGNSDASQAMENYAKARYRSYHGSDNGWDQIVKDAATQNSPPQEFSQPTIGITPSPAELAVRAVEHGDDLSLSDFEFILRYRDASPSNKKAAEKVWQALQQNGRMKIPIKVISATTEMIQGAISDDNQEANRADIQIAMQKPMTHPPAPGTTIKVTGVMTDYTPDPFIFIMAKGELPDAPVAHAQLSVADIEELLRGGVSPKHAAALVKQKGVDFALDDVIEARLRKAGATDELLLAIATSNKKK